VRVRFQRRAFPNRSVVLGGGNMGCGEEPLRGGIEVYVGGGLINAHIGPQGPLKPCEKR
jgi:hypothetical protein